MHLWKGCHKNEWSKILWDIKNNLGSAHKKTKKNKNQQNKPTTHNYRWAKIKYQPKREAHLHTKQVQANLVVLVLYFCEPFAFYVHFLASYQFVQDVTRMQQWPVYICLKLASNTYPTSSCQRMIATDFKKVPVNLVLHFNKTSSFVVCRHSMCNCYQTANGDCV